MPEDLEWAAAHAPVLYFDREEPFLPSRVGYTVMRRPKDSPVDFRRTLAGGQPLSFDLPGLEAVIEYAIWWDWDIEHLYELEAAWVYLGAGGVLRVEASWHGRFHEMRVRDQPPLRDRRPVLLSQPGKHAFAPEASWFEPHDKFIRPCREMAGSGGVLVTDLFRGRIEKAPGDDARAAAYLRERAFTPSFVFDREFAVEEKHLCPWPELQAWIPGRVQAILKALGEGRTID